MKKDSQITVGDISKPDQISFSGMAKNVKSNDSLHMSQQSNHKNAYICDSNLHTESSQDTPTHNR